MTGTSTRSTSVPNERGMALVIVLLAAGLLTALAAALVVVTSAETQIAANFRDGQEALNAADVGLEWAVESLRAAPIWSGVLAGTVPSGFAGATLYPDPPGGGPVIDLAAATAQLQAAASAGRWGADTPVWRLWVWGPVSDLLPAGSIDSRMYVAVWVADDVADADADPLSDHNGLVTLHSEAYGPGGTRRVVEASVARRDQGGGALGEGGAGAGLGPAGEDVRVLAWTEIR